MKIEYTGKELQTRPPRRTPTTTYTNNKQKELVRERTRKKPTEKNKHTYKRETTKSKKNAAKFKQTDK